MMSTTTPTGMIMIVPADMKRGDVSEMPKRRQTLYVISKTPSIIIYEKQLIPPPHGVKGSTKTSTCHDIQHRNTGQTS